MGPVHPDLTDRPYERSPGGERIYWLICEGACNSEIVPLENREVAAVCRYTAHTMVGETIAECRECGRQRRYG
jgi:hypothetical protein